MLHKHRVLCYNRHVNMGVYGCSYSSNNTSLFKPPKGGLINVVYITTVRGNYKMGSLRGR